MLELISISKEYQLPAEDRSTIILNDISLKVTQAQSLLIIWWGEFVQEFVFIVQQAQNGYAEGLLNGFCKAR